jgi:LEA14-like dessication related protein
MNYTRRQTITALILGLTLLGGCASISEDAISKPVVELRDIEVAGLGFNAQTFLLTFDVSNPNPFPLPLNSIKYRLSLDGQRFASGETPCEMSIPAGGETDFAISVELDLLSTAPQLLTLVRDNKRNDIPYELRGEFGIDIPLVPTVSYQTRGSIRLD